MSGKDRVRVAIVGYAFMGAAHSQAWRTVNRVFDLPVVAEMRVLCGRDEQRARAAADQLGWAEVETDWRRVAGRAHHRLRAHVHPRAAGLPRGARDGHGPAASFAGGLQVQRVLAAVETSAGDAGRWTPVDR
jgi:hypothetical protein